MLKRIYFIFIYGHISAVFIILPGTRVAVENLIASPAQSYAGFCHTVKQCQNSHRCTSQGQGGSWGSPWGQGIDITPCWALKPLWVFSNLCQLLIGTELRKLVGFWGPGGGIGCGGGLCCCPIPSWARTTPLVCPPLRMSQTACYPPPYPRTPSPSSAENLMSTGSSSHLTSTEVQHQHRLPCLCLFCPGCCGTFAPPLPRQCTGDQLCLAVGLGSQSDHDKLFVCFPFTFMEKTA